MISYLLTKTYNIKYINRRSAMNNKLKEMFEEGQEIEDIFYALTDEAMDSMLEQGYEELGVLEKKAFLIGKYLGEVNNGGFDQYFLNTQGRYARETVELLDSMGEKNFAKLMDEAISIYKAVIPDDVKMDKFNELDDKFYCLSTQDYENLYHKLVDYLKDYEEDL